MIRRYLIWRNTHARDERLRRIVDRANIALSGTSVGDDIRLVSRRSA
jgi:hypothetical protein